MNFLETNIIKQFTKKSEQELAVEKFNNYPYQALEELVVNSLYHRSYENSQPNEIRIYKNGSNRRIEILSYPGPLPPINNDALIQLNIVARNYRNIRLGDWLKNLRLAEKYATGIPTVVSSLDKNGSPKPILSTDEDRSYFLAVIQIHPDTPSSEQSSIDSSTNHVPLSDIQQEILDLLLDNPMLENVIKQKFGDNYPIDEDIDFLIEHELVSFSDILTLGKQFYITRRGIAALRNTF
jgi:ATP-dependent DNA helicase RecG